MGNLAARRIFVIWTHPLFLEAVRLLLTCPEIEWLGDTSDHRLAREKITDLHPDTVLVEEDQNVLADIVGILEANTTKVVRLSLEANALSVYHREDRTITHADDLLRLIQDK